MLKHFHTLCVELKKALAVFKNFISESRNQMYKDCLGFAFGSDVILLGNLFRNLINGIGDF
jgi:hypothetical protein